MAYRRKQLPLEVYRVEAIKELSELPEWLRDYRLAVGDEYGNATIGLTITRELMIPTQPRSVVAKLGQYVVLEAGALQRYTDKEFNEIFETVDAESAA